MARRPPPKNRHYTSRMARTHKKVRFLPKGKPTHTEASAAKGVEEVLRILEGRWKLVILFHLFGGEVRRFSELRRAIPAVSEKMLIQQLRQMERDGVVRRFVHDQVPPKVEYSLTDWGQGAVSCTRRLADVGRSPRLAHGTREHIGTGVGSRTGRCASRPGAS